MLIKALKTNSNKISQPTTTNTPEKVEINILTQSFIEILLFITQHKKHKLISVLTTIIIIPEYSSNANCTN